MMELKSYQQTTLTALERYLAALNAEQIKAKQVSALNLGIEYEWDEKAWKQVLDRPYTRRTTGAGNIVPSICLKIPTGGGKTLLAAHSIDSINRVYRRTQYGMVLWIVPTNAIYRQTLKALRDRAHPYRQILDNSSGGRTQIIEKDALFQPADVEAQLVVLLLMLPSANRQNKETLRIFRDRGGFDAFFPREDQWQQHEELHARIPNLDTFEDTSVTGAPQLKTSLGNTLRLLNPLIVLDEGHKAYSATAQSTLMGFNPCFVLELSATPARESNTIVDISGMELLREGMIKLDMHLRLCATVDWHDTLRESHEKRAELERLADEYRSNGGLYIRPICLIQVERTGDKQRKAGFIHAEDVREHLVTRLNVPPEHIAVKSSARDELEDTDLLAETCHIRYIITRSALQEGWDCPFAYVLSVLPNSEQSASLTQLIGRILRQPYARKTPIDALNESYTFCYRERSQQAIQSVQAGLAQEGMSDIAGRVILDTNISAAGRVNVLVRPKNERFVGNVYLPCFVVPGTQGGYREFNYQADLLSRIDWDSFELNPVDRWELNPTTEGDASIRVNLTSAINAISVTTASETDLDPVFFSRQVADIVPNPWVAYDYAKQTVDLLKRRFQDTIIRRNRSFIIDELRKLLIIERNTLAETAFREMIASEELRFYLIKGVAGTAVPERVTVANGTPRLVHNDNSPIQRSLFDYEPENQFNTYERAVALYLDKQDRVLWWYRNIANVDYSVQGWQPHRVYPDQVALSENLAPASGEKSKTVYVIETKGLHLKNEDTNYKQALFNICNEQAKPQPWDTIKDELADQQVKFQLLFSDEWEKVLNAVFAA